MMTMFLSSGRKTILGAGLALLLLPLPGRGDDQFTGLGLRGVLDTDINERTQELNWMLKVRLSSIEHSPEYADSTNTVSQNELVQFLTQIVHEEQGFLDSLKSMSPGDRRWALKQFEPIQKQEILAFSDQERDEDAPDANQPNDLAWLTGSERSSSWNQALPAPAEEPNQGYDPIIPIPAHEPVPPPPARPAPPQQLPAPVFVPVPVPIYRQYPVRTVAYGFQERPRYRRRRIENVMAGLQSVPFQRRRFNTVR